MGEANQVKTAKTGHDNKQAHAQPHSTPRLSFSKFNDLLELIYCLNLLSPVFEFGVRPQQKCYSYKGRSWEQHSIDGHPEISEEAFPEERKLLFFFWGIYIEEQSA